MEVASLAISSDVHKLRLFPNYRRVFNLCRSLTAILVVTFPVSSDRRTGRGKGSAVGAGKNRGGVLKAKSSLGGSRHTL